MVLGPVAPPGVQKEKTRGVKKLPPNGLHGECCQSFSRTQVVLKYNTKYYITQTFLKFGGIVTVILCLA